MGRVVAALLRGDAPYATGSVINVDGGLSLPRDPDLQHIGPGAWGSGHRATACCTMTERLLVSEVRHVRSDDSGDVRDDGTAGGRTRETTVRAFVFTATGASGEHTPEEQGRLDAVQRRARRARKKKGITLVNSRADANLTIEVVSREQGEEPGGGYGGKSIAKMGDTIIRLHLKSGEEESDLKGMGQGTWGRAAKDAADRIVEWIARREPTRKKSAVGS